MVISRTLAAVAGAVLVAGTLLAGGVALADSNTANPNANPSAVTAPADRAGHLDDMVKSGKMTQAEADVAKQLMDLRKSAMTQLRANEKSLLDQADKLTQRHGGRHNRHAGAGKGMGMNKLSKDELQAKLADAVKSGKMTQQQADKVMEKWQKHQTNAK